MFLHKPGREKVTKTEITRIEHGKEELINLIEQILKEAKSQGATSAEADIGTGAGLSVTVRMGDGRRDRRMISPVWFAEGANNVERTTSSSACHGAGAAWSMNGDA